MKYGVLAAMFVAPSLPHYVFADLVSTSGCPWLRRSLARPLEVGSMTCSFSRARVPSTLKLLGLRDLVVGTKTLGPTRTSRVSDAHTYGSRSIDEISLLSSELKTGETIIRS